MSGEPSAPILLDKRLLDTFQSRRERAGWQADLINLRIGLVKFSTWLGLFGTIVLIVIALCRITIDRWCLGFTEILGHLIHLGLIGELLRKFKGFPSPHPESGPGVQVLVAGEKGADLMAFVHSVALEVGIAPQSIRVVLHKDVEHFGPSVIETKHIPGWTSSHEQAVLVVPMGFFKLFRGQRAIASALLTHEMAHLLSEDTNRWHQSCTYRGVVWLLIASSVVGFVTTCLSRAVDSGDVFKGTENQAQRMGEGLGPLLYSVLYPVIVWSHIRYIRSCRRFSEISADCCAAAYCGLDTLRAALDHCVAHSDKNAPSKGYHPPLKYRLRRLAERYRERWGIVGRAFAVLALAGNVTWLVCRYPSGDIGNETVFSFVVMAYVLPLGWYRDWLVRE
jgi:hypothetical protein